MLLTNRENIHVGYFVFALGFVLTNLISVNLLGFQTQIASFVALFFTYCKPTKLNLIHAGFVFLHGFIHRYTAYFTICETGKTTIDEYWHIFYLILLYFRVGKDKKAYYFWTGLYMFFSVFALLTPNMFWLWCLYLTGFLLAYQLLWYESGTPANSMYWLLFLAHGVGSLIITFDNPAGRFFLTGVPGGSAFFSECLCYCFLNDGVKVKDLVPNLWPPQVTSSSDTLDEKNNVVTPLEVTSPNMPDEREKKDEKKRQ